MIAGDPRFDANVQWSDEAILDWLQAPSTRVVLFRRRLKYLARIPKGAPDTLLAILASPGAEKTPWVQTVLADLAVLFSPMDSALEECFCEGDGHYFSTFAERAVGWAATHGSAWKRIADIISDVVLAAAGEGDGGSDTAAVAAAGKEPPDVVALIGVAVALPAPVGLACPDCDVPKRRR